MHAASPAGAWLTRKIQDLISAWPPPAERICLHDVGGMINADRLHDYKHPGQGHETIPVHAAEDARRWA